MIEASVANAVALALRKPWLTVILSLVVTLASMAYIATHFAITTDTSQLISSTLDWRQRERQLDDAFPQHSDTIDVVVDGTTPELAEKATRDLATALSAYKPKPFEIVRRRDGGAFLEKIGRAHV